MMTQRQFLEFSRNIYDTAKKENRNVTEEELAKVQEEERKLNDFLKRARTQIKMEKSTNDNTFGLTMRQLKGMDKDIESRAIVSSGSALIQNPNVVDDIVYALQSSNPLFDAGVQFVNIENNRQVPSVTAYPTANWVTEGSTLSATDPTIGSIKWELKDIAVLVKVKNNVLYDAKANVQRLINEITTRSINDAILQAMFSGATGSNQPEGIDNFSGVLEVSMGTDGDALDNTNTYPTLVSAARKLMDVNIDLNAISYIYNPTVAEDIANLRDTMGPLQPPPLLENVKQFITTAVKSDYTQGATANTTRIYAGDFSKMVVGLGGEFSIVLDQRYADELTTGFIVHTRIDMKPLYENAFCIIKGITTT